MWQEHHPRRHALRFRYAWEGIVYVFQTQANFRLHVLSAALLLVLAGLLQFSLIEWIILLLSISFILTLEMLNTALEVVVDHLWQVEHPKAKAIKDIAAGVVLIAAVCVGVAGVLLYLPKLLTFFARS